MASAVALSNFLELYCHVLLQTRHLRVDLAFRMWNLAPFIGGVAICLSANRSIGGSICWSAPTLIVTSEISVKCSWVAICCAEASIASASAHSCIGLELFFVQFKGVLFGLGFVFCMLFLDVDFGSSEFI